MQDIVEAALEDTAGEGETADRESDDFDGFGRPRFAFVGCGEVGIARANAGVDSTLTGRPHDPIEFDVTTVAVESGDLETTEDRTDLAAKLEATDLAVVTTHLTDPQTAGLTAVATECLPADATVVAVVSVSEMASVDGFSAAFSELVDAADTTIPIEFGRVGDGYDPSPEQSDGADDEPVHALVDDLVAELTTDVFEMAHAPLAAPLNVADFYDLLDTGGVALAYRGWGTRDDVAADLLDHAVTHRLCDGDVAGVASGLGFCRFGSEFLLSDYETLFEEAADRFGSPPVESGRWLNAGNSVAGLDEECRLTLLLTRVDPSSLAFFDPE